MTELERDKRLRIHAVGKRDESTAIGRRPSRL